MAKRSRRRGPDTRVAIRTMEDIAVSWTVAALRSAGHVVREEWSPDHDRERLPERIRRPDWFCMVDDVPTAIEHTSFLTDDRGRAWALQARAGDDVANKVRVLRITDRADATEFDAFLDQVVARKGPQYVAWGRGILVVTHNLDQPWEALRDAVERRGGVPWWRVYWVERTPPPVLVWEST